MKMRREWRRTKQERNEMTLEREAKRKKVWETGTFSSLVEEWEEKLAEETKFEVVEEWEQTQEGSGEL